MYPINSKRLATVLIAIILLFFYQKSYAIISDTITTNISWSYPSEVVHHISKNTNILAKDTSCMYVSKVNQLMSSQHKVCTNRITKEISRYTKSNDTFVIVIMNSYAFYAHNKKKRQTLEKIAVYSKKEGTVTFLFEISVTYKTPLRLLKTKEKGLIITRTIEPKFRKYKNVQKAVLSPQTIDFTINNTTSCEKVRYQKSLSGSYNAVVSVIVYNSKRYNNKLLKEQINFFL